MIKRIDRPVACACRVRGFFSCLEKQTFVNRQTGAPGEKIWTREKMRSGGTDVLDRQSVLCSILCLYSLKEYMVSVQVKYMELWTSREEMLSHPRHFFARMEVFLFCFFSLCFVLSMVLRLDAEHIENKPNVGRREFIKKRKKATYFSHRRRLRALLLKEKKLLYNL